MKAKRTVTLSTGRKVHPPHENPLPCGCGAKGWADDDCVSPSIAYRGIHVSFCPLHAAAGALYNALLVMVRQNAQGHAIGHDAIVDARAVLLEASARSGQRVDWSKEGKVKLGAKWSL